MRRNRTVEQPTRTIDYGVRIKELPPRPYAEQLSVLGVSNERIKALNRLPIDIAVPIVDWVLHLAGQALLVYPEQYPTDEHNAARHASNNEAIKLLVENEVESALTGIVGSIGTSTEALHRMALVEDALLRYDTTSSIGKHYEEMAVTNATKLEDEVRKSVAGIIANTRRAYLQEYEQGYNMGAHKIHAAFGLGVVALEKEAAKHAGIANNSGSNHRVWKVTATAATGLVLTTTVAALPAAANPNSTNTTVSAKASAEQIATSSPLATVVEQVMSEANPSLQTATPESATQPDYSASSVNVPAYNPEVITSAPETGIPSVTTQIDVDKTEVESSNTAANGESNENDSEIIAKLAEKVNPTLEGYKRFSINTEYNNAFSDELHGEKIKEYKYFVGHWTADLYDDGVKGAIQAMKSRDKNCCSSQLFMDKNANVYQLVPYDEVAWHAIGANYTSLGIEIEARNLKDYTPEQLEAFVYTYIYIWKKLGLELDAEQIVGHEWVDENLAGDEDAGKIDMPTELVELLRPIFAKLIDQVNQDSAQNDNQNDSPDTPAPTDPSNPGDQTPTDPTSPDDQTPTDPSVPDTTPAPNEDTETQPDPTLEPEIIAATAQAQAADESALQPQPSSANNAEAKVVSEELQTGHNKFRELIDKAIESKDLNTVLGIEAIDKIALHDDDVEVLKSYRAFYNAILANDTAIIQMLNNFDPSTLTEEQKAAYATAINSTLSTDPSNDLSAEQKLAIAVINDRLGDYFEDDIAKAVKNMNESEATPEAPDDQESPQDDQDQDGEQESKQDKRVYDVMADKGQYHYEGDPNNDSDDRNASWKNMAYIHKQFVKAGYTPNQADGFVANCVAESGCNPKMNQKGGPAYGIFQWEGSRKENLFKLDNYDTLEVQVKFALSELRGPEAAARQKIKETVSSKEAAKAVCTEFERAGEPHMGSRTGPAQEIHDTRKEIEKDISSGRGTDNSSRSHDSGGSEKERATRYANELNINTSDIGIGISGGWIQFHIDNNVAKRILNLEDYNGYPENKIGLPKSERNDADPNGMYWGECVSWVMWRIGHDEKPGDAPHWAGTKGVQGEFGIYGGGNAKGWIANAKAEGIRVDDKPAVGSVLVSTRGKFGHVMYVERVLSDGSVVVSQMNEDGGGAWSVEVIPIEQLEHGILDKSYSFVHLEEGKGPTQ